MTDILVRDVPDDVVAAVELRAAGLGLSLSEYLGRRLAQEVSLCTTPMTADDLASFVGTFSDLTDPEVMRAAWK